MAAAEADVTRGTWRVIRHTSPPSPVPLVAQQLNTRMHFTRPQLNNGNLTSTCLLVPGAEPPLETCIFQNRFSGLFLHLPHRHHLQPTENFLLSKFSHAAS